MDSIESIEVLPVSVLAAQPVTGAKIESTWSSCSREAWKMPPGCPEIENRKEFAEDTDCCDLPELEETEPVLNQTVLPLPDVDFNNDTYCVNVAPKLTINSKYASGKMKWGLDSGQTDCTVGRYALDLDLTLDCPTAASLDDRSGVMGMNCCVDLQVVDCEVVGLVKVPEIVVQQGICGDTACDVFTPHEYKENPDECCPDKLIFTLPPPPILDSNLFCHEEGAYGGDPDTGQGALPCVVPKAKNLNITAAETVDDSYLSITNTSEGCEIGFQIECPGCVKLVEQLKIAGVIDDFDPSGKPKKCKPNNSLGSNCIDHYPDPKSLEYKCCVAKSGMTPAGHVCTIPPAACCKNGKCNGSGCDGNHGSGDDGNPLCSSGVGGKDYWEDPITEDMYEYEPYESTDRGYEF